MVMVNRKTNNIIVTASSNQATADDALSGVLGTSWSPKAPDTRPTIVFTVKTPNGQNPRYFNVKVSVEGVRSIHVFVIINGEKIDTHFKVSI